MMSSVVGPFRVMTTRFVNGTASLPTSKRPVTAIHPAVRFRSAGCNRSVPRTVRLVSGGGLTSSSTVLPAGIVTAAPAAGTIPSGQVAGSDQRSDGAGGGGGGGAGGGVGAVLSLHPITRVKTMAAVTRNAREVAMDIFSWERRIRRSCRMIRERAIRGKIGSSTIRADTPASDCTFPWESSSLQLPPPAQGRA